MTMDNERTTISETDDEFMKYMKRIKDETRSILNKKWNSKKYGGSATWLLARYSMNKDPEFAEEAATYILAATYLERGKK